MNVDIYIKMKSTGRSLRIPLLPEEITANTGDGKFVTYDIMGKGEVAVPTGVGLAKVGWESEFPGKDWPVPSMIRGTNEGASYYHSLLQKFKRDKTVLNLMVTGYPINMDVYVSRYTAKASGPFGNISYEVEFTKHEDIVVKTSTVASSTKSSTTKRTVAETKIHVVKSGDTCWSISLKYYKNGLEWPKIYKANKEIIERTAKKHGKSSSDNGWWIYPGIRLVIP